MRGPSGSEVAKCAILRHRRTGAQWAVIGARARGSRSALGARGVRGTCAKPLGYRPRLPGPR
eukprot:12687377-Alexandrium_andersonii.AAC.1